MTLEALNEAEFKPIALPKKDFFTTIETKTNLTGWYIALKIPYIKVKIASEKIEWAWINCK